MKTLLLAAIIVNALLAQSSFAQAPSSQDWPKANPEAVAKWQDKRFGMFIHWGPVSLSGKEIGWSRGAETPIGVYDNLYKQFNPTNFDADAWVGVAKAAGVKYIVLTTKHHDGFCLWDTKFTDYNIMHTPFHRDVVKELSEACRKQGIDFGCYYSTCDWHHPDFPLTSPGGSVKREKSDLDAYNRYLLNQIQELITNYGPLITIWNDIPQMFEGRGKNTIKLVRSLQPDILINDRTGDGGDYDTPERRIGKYQDTRPWETCLPLCDQWSWKPDDQMIPLSQCIQTLTACAGGNGNLLLNVAPTPTGEIELHQIQRLKEVGDWLTKNGESIYGTRGGPWKPTKTTASTRKGNTIYIHVFHDHGDTVELPNVPCKIKSASLLNGNQVKVKKQHGKLVINLPAVGRDPIDTVIKLTLNKSAMDLATVSAGSKVKATASNIYHNQASDYGPQCAFDGETTTRWATDDGTKQAWIAVDLGRRQKIKRLRVEEAFPGRVQKFECQYSDGSQWKTLFTGTTLGEHFEKEFEPVTAREFRLNILDASEGPTLSEIDFLSN